MEGSDLLRTFEAELQQGSERIQYLLLEIEPMQNTPEAFARLQEVYRIVHSIKGASRVVGLSNIEDLAHTMEDRLQNQLSTKQKPTGTETSVFLRIAEAFVASFRAFLSGESFDTSGYMTELTSLNSSNVTSTAPALPAAQPIVESRAAADETPAASTKREESVNVPVNRIDELFRRVEEAFLIESRLSALLEDLNKNIQESSNGNLSQLWQKGAPNLFNETNRLHFVLLQFHELVRLFRMVPMRRLRVPLHRAVRELATTLGKPATLNFKGDEEMVDASTLESLQDPILHLVRNALDHGVEPAEERVRNGKSREAMITVQAATTGGFLQIEVSDDGRGIDLEKIRQKALDQNMMSAEEADAWTQQDWMELLFRPNFSTAETVTAVSGRGIGLDIVRRRIQDIGGKVEVTSTPQIGTTFQIHVPIGMLTPRVLLVRCGEHSAAVSTSEIERVFPFRSSNVEVVDGQRLVRWHQIPIPVEPLANYLSWPADAISIGHVLVVNVHGMRMGLLVNEIIGEIEQVAFPPPWNMRGIPYLGGVIVLGNGSLVPLVETRDVSRGKTVAPERMEAVAAPAEEIEKRPTLLVVDDSPTILALHRSILRNAGYEIITAEDGAAAWKILQDQSVDLILTDIEMPRMNGLELIRKVREKRGSKHLPIVVVSQYGARSDLQKAAEAGADRYLVKSAFDPQRLLETIQELLD